jgi:hypothetical protein
VWNYTESAVNWSAQLALDEKGESRSVAYVYPRGEFLFTVKAE